MTEQDSRKKGRVILNEGTVLNLSASPDGSDAKSYRIISYLDAGGSSVCYNAEELITSRTGILKEFYPAGDTFSFNRTENHVLISAGSTKPVFGKMKEDYIAPYKLLHETGGIQTKKSRLLRNYIQDSIVLYDGNGNESSTVYVWTTGFAGETPDKYFDDLKKNPHISEKQKLIGILNVIRSVTSGLTAMHSNGFMHLDIKPSNILVHYDGEGIPNPANISFFDIDCLYQFGERVPRGIGTDGYRAPELMKGEADHRSDVYSVGAMLFTAITGTAYSLHLFTGISEAVREAPLIKNMISNATDSIIINLLDILHKCLAFSPDERYRGCSRLNDDILRLIGLCTRSDKAARPKLIRHECLDPNAVIQKLLYKHPLYTCLSPDKNRIDVMVIGSDQFARLLIDNALQSGQMKDRLISVRVLCDDPVQTRKEYLALRQELPRFVATDASQDTEGLYGSISFEAFPSDLTFGSGKNKEETNRILADILLDNIPEYVFISLDTTAKSKAAAKAFDYVLHCRELVRPICYVNDGTPPENPHHIKNGPIPVYILEDVSAESFHPTLNRMAFSTDLSWGRAVHTDIRSDFNKFITDQKNRYNYRSSVSFVLSIKYKLFSCGILLKEDTTDPERMTDAGFIIIDSEDEAAQVFSENILRRKDTDESAARTIRSLIALEHKRWVLEKVCLGWQGLDFNRLSSDIENLISGSSERGKIYDGDKKIHHCIAFGSEDMPLSAPEYSSGNRRLWEDSEPEEFDELDRISLLLHRHYMAEVKRIGARSPDSDISELSAMLTNSDNEVRIALKQFLLCLSGISTGVSGYVKQYGRLRDRFINTLPDETVQNRAKQFLRNIDRFYFPFLQAYGYTDYKSLDSTLINDIPFILTYRFCDELVMPFSDGHQENFRNQACFSNVASPTVLCPQSVKYFYHCEDSCQTEEVKIKLDAVLKYFSRRNINCTVTFTILCRKGHSCGDRLLNAVELLKKAPTGSGAYLKDACILPYSDLSEVSETILNCFTNGKNVLFDVSVPLFSSYAQNSLLISTLCNRSVPYFEFDTVSKSFVHTSECAYLAFIRDHSYITVSDMFSLMNASDITFEIPEFLHDYQTLWNIYSTNAGSHNPEKDFEYSVMNWSNLCKLLDAHFENVAPVDKITMNEATPNEMTAHRTFQFSADMENAARELLSRLISYRIIAPRSGITRQTSDIVRIDIFCRPSVSDKMDTLCKWLNEHKKLVFNYYALNKETVIYPETLEAKGVDLSRKGDEEGVHSKSLLKTLENKGYIKNLDVSDIHKVSFSFTSRRIKRLLTKAGEIVEIFVYCELLKSGSFDDIRKGFGFYWYGNRVENELDIVLTKGFCSMIIEVKAVEKLDMDFYHKLYSLSSQFGINAKTTIVNNDYRSNSFFMENNELQSERGEQLHIKTFSGRKEIESIGERLVQYMENL